MTFRLASQVDTNDDGGAELPFAVSLARHHRPRRVPGILCSDLIGNRNPSGRRSASSTWPLCHRWSLRLCIQVECKIGQGRKSKRASQMRSDAEQAAANAAAAAVEAEGGDDDDEEAWKLKRHGGR